MKRIKRNRAQCRQCGTILVSESVHDFRTCPCGVFSVDGGLSYVRRVGSNYIELTEYLDTCDTLEERREEPYD